MPRAASLCAICVLTLAPAASWAQSRGQSKAEFSDEAVKKGIERGVAYLWSQQQSNGGWEGQGNYPDGPGALAMLALLESGVTPQDARMGKALDWLSRIDSTKTYCLGLRCNVWLAADAKTQGKYAKRLEVEVMRLVNSTARGSYGYESQGDGKSAGDNSNSQYGLLGVWAGARADPPLEIATDYWYKVYKHWQRTQNGDGGWGYTQEHRTTRATLAAAGVASLYVCFDNLFCDGFVKCDLGEEGAGVQKAIFRGLGWFEKNFASTVSGISGRYYYYMYGVERVGLACGYKYFGTADWYKLGAAQLCAKQASNGSWGGVVDTSFALMYLIRGRHAVLFNKLQYDGSWNNRPRDAATLTRWISRKFENTVNWQIINLKVPVTEWHDAPILYIAGSKRPNFTETDLEKLRSFVWQGGTIFSLTECSGSEFAKGMRETYAKLFPRYELSPCGPKHEVYSVHFDLRGKPRLHELSNGVRPLAIHCDEDLALAWQTYSVATNISAFEAAANVAIYVTDKHYIPSGGRPRGTSPWPEAASFSPRATVKLARLKHSGNYDPEPLAHERFARLMGQEAQVKVELLGPMEISELAGSGAKVACLTGTGRLELTADQQEALRKFVEGGGTLVLDAAGGTGPFAESAERLLSGMFGRENLRRLSGSSDLFQMKGLEIGDVRYRRRTRQRLGMSLKEPNLRAVLVEDRPGVIFSAEDLTAGLVGYSSYVVDGYDPDVAYRILRNIVASACGYSPPALAPATPRPS